MRIPDIAGAQRVLFAAIAKAYGADNHVAAVITDVEMDRWAGEPMSAASAQQIANSIRTRCSKL